MMTLFLDDRAGSTFVHNDTTTDKIGTIAGIFDLEPIDHYIAGLYLNDRCTVSTVRRTECDTRSGALLSFNDQPFFIQRSAHKDGAMVRSLF